jgi:Tol biopolymer transport system component
LPYPYTIAFASLGPLNTDLFTADADGRNPQPLVPHADNDYNALFSHDGRWIVFTSHPNGSADGRSDRSAQLDQRGRFQVPFYPRP